MAGGAAKNVSRRVCAPGPEANSIQCAKQVMRRKINAGEVMEEYSNTVTCQDVPHVSVGLPVAAIILDACHLTFHRFLSECGAVDYFPFERFNRHFVLKKTGCKASQLFSAASFTPAADPTGSAKTVANSARRC